MAGEAITDKFMLGTATVMIGPVDELHNLNDAEHSVGLVKNFSTEATKEYTELTQGIRNDLVASVVTGAPVSGGFEMYEYTPRNLGYALSLDVAGLATDDTVAEIGESSLTAALAPTYTAGTNSSDMGVMSDAAWTAAPADGDLIVMELFNPAGDHVDSFIVKYKAGDEAANIELYGDYSKLTVGDNGWTLKFYTPDVLSMGDDGDAREYSMKVVGELEDGSRCVIEYPKVRVTSGLALAFSTDQFGNMPFQFDVLKLLKSDALYSEFRNQKAKLAFL